MFKSVYENYSRKGEKKKENACVPTPKNKWVLKVRIIRGDMCFSFKDFFITHA